MNTAITIEKIAFKYGSLIAIMLIAFFLIMKLVGLAHIYELRALNFFFLTFGVWQAFRYLKRNDQEFSYFKGLGTGIFTTAFSLLIFSIFVFIYTNILDPEFMVQLKENAPFGEYLNPYIASFVIFFEGTISGVIVSFGMMQYFKVSHMDKDSKVV
jgi:hypothetical protein